MPGAVSFGAPRSPEQPRPPCMGVSPMLMTRYGPSSAANTQYDNVLKKEKWGRYVHQTLSLNGEFKLSSKDADRQADIMPGYNSLKLAYNDLGWKRDPTGKGVPPDCKPMRRSSSRQQSTSRTRKSRQRGAQPQHQDAWPNCESLIRGSAAGTRRSASVASSAAGTTALRSTPCTDDVPKKCGSRLGDETHLSAADFGTATSSTMAAAKLSRSRSDPGTGFSAASNLSAPASMISRAAPSTSSVVTKASSAASAPSALQSRPPSDASFQASQTTSIAAKRKKPRPFSATGALESCPGSEKLAASDVGNRPSTAPVQAARSRKGKKDQPTATAPAPLTGFVADKMMCELLAKRTRQPFVFC